MIKFQHTKHRALWGMIISMLLDLDKDISSAAKLKLDAFDELYAGYDEPLCTCYACAYDEDINDMFPDENRPEDCVNCPLSWPDDKVCDISDSLYANFVDACHNKDRKAAVKYAIDIRDCPVKKDVETE